MLKVSIQPIFALAFCSCSSCYAALNPQIGLWESTSEIPAEQKAMFQNMPPEALQRDAKLRHESRFQSWHDDEHFLY